jgi:hypothetical protein
MAHFMDWLIESGEFPPQAFQNTTLVTESITDNTSVMYVPNGRADIVYEVVVEDDHYRAIPRLHRDQIIRLISEGYRPCKNMGRQLRFGKAPYEPVDTEGARLNWPWQLEFIGFGHHSTRSQDVATFQLEVRESEIRNAGEGLFLRGTVKDNEWVVKMVTPEYMSSKNFERLLVKCNITDERRHNIALLYGNHFIVDMDTVKDYEYELGYWSKLNTCRNHPTVHKPNVKVKVVKLNGKWS